MWKHRFPAAVCAALFAVTAGACGADAGAQESSATSTTPATVAMPDLNDPSVRQQFADSFSEGYFMPPAATAVTTAQPADTDCR